MIIALKLKPPQLPNSSAWRLREMPLRARANHAERPNRSRPRKARRASSPQRLISHAQTRRDRAAGRRVHHAESAQNRLRVKDRHRTLSPACMAQFVEMTSPDKLDVACRIVYRKGSIGAG